jgi:NDP-sugar pyrophosphorylase family protein
VVGQASFLEIQIGLLERQGAHRFVLCVGHHANQIQAALGDGAHLGVHIEYSAERGSLLGTAGALKLAERWFAPRALVLNGDTYFALDYARFVRFHDDERRRDPSVVASLCLGPAGDRRQCGSVELDRSGCRVVAFREKDAHATPKWLNGGAYVIENDLLRNVPVAQPCSLERAGFPRALARGQRLAAWISRRRFFDIGTPESLESFRCYYLKSSCNEPCSLTATA